MKTIYKNLMLGSFLTVFAAFTAAPTFAQDACADVDANQALYKKYIDNYAGTMAQKKIAVEAGKEYIQKYEACATATKDAAGVEKKTLTFAEQITYFKENVPVLEKAITDQVNLEGDKAMYGRFNAATKAKNVAEILASGKEVLAKYPTADSSLDVAIVMASAAFDEVIAKPTVTTYNKDLITYAKKAIELIEAGKTSKTYGAGAYQLQTKPKALGVLNYSIGLAMLGDPAQKKDAAAYFYKSSQYDSVFKNNPLLYRAIGSNYLDEFLAFDKKRKEIIVRNENKDNEESLAMEAMQKGYADRAIEAYAIAYKIAKADPKQKATADAVSTTLKDLYAFRFNGKTLDNVDTYVTTVASKPLTNPTTTVTPVKEEAPATTPPTSGATTPSATTPTTTTPATKPATKPATTPTKPVSSATTDSETTPEADTTATTTKTKTKAKKPAPKKKGTR